MARIKNKLKHKRCSECGLRIRCGSVERHNEGLSHKRIVERLKKVRR